MNDVNIWMKRVNTYGSIAVTIFIFLLFLFGMVMTAAEADRTAFNALLETVKALAMVAAGFWIGTSQSSHKKDDIIAEQMMVANGQK